MGFSSRRWQFDWRLLVFSGVFLPLLISLGVWQLNRAAEKTSLLETWNSESPPGRDWQDVAAADGWQEGQPVTLTGWYRDETWLLDNRTRAGRAGYEVLTLFEPVSGPFVVINRGGWVPAPASREQLPEVKTPEPLFTLQGRLAAIRNLLCWGGRRSPIHPAGRDGSRRCRRAGSGCWAARRPPR